MGDTSDLMLDGVLCQECGSVFDDMVPNEAEFARAKREKRMPVSDLGAPGHPRTCRACKYDCDDNGRTRP